jgi:hypothetical protein
MEVCLSRESLRDSSTIRLYRVSGIIFVPENLGKERWITQGTVYQRRGCLSLGLEGE